MSVLRLLGGGPGSRFTCTSIANAPIFCWAFWMRVLLLVGTSILLLTAVPRTIYARREMGNNHGDPSQKWDRKDTNKKSHKRKTRGSNWWEKMPVHFLQEATAQENETLKKQKKTRNATTPHRHWLTQQDGNGVRWSIKIDKCNFLGNILSYSVMRYIKM